MKEPFYLARKEKHKAMKTIENKKIFDIRNPNCIIITPIEDITKMFNNTPIFNMMNTENNSPVGLVREVTSHDENCIYGNLVVFDDSINLSDMINYEVITEYINKNCEAIISSVCAVCYENIQ